MIDDVWKIQYLFTGHELEDITVLTVFITTESLRRFLFNYPLYTDQRLVISK